MSIKGFIKRLLPAGLLGRALLIIFVPLLLLQLFTAWFFFDRHWERITWRFASSVAGEIAFLIDRLEQNPDRQLMIIDRAMRDFEFTQISIKPDEILPNEPLVKTDQVSQLLSAALDQWVSKPHSIIASNLLDEVLIDIQLANGVIEITVPGRRLFSSSNIALIGYMVGASLILFAIAAIFMRNQVRPLMRLSLAVEAFGKGEEPKDPYKLEGALEVRQAAIAFNRMSERIRRQIRQRTDMLSGVSHDLRTPMTRMMLQIEFLEDEGIKNELHTNLDEMQNMISAYLNFARGEGDEPMRKIDLNHFLDQISGAWRANDIHIDAHTEGNIQFQGRPIALRRALDNMIANSSRYAQTIRVQISKRKFRRQEGVEILLDDDGPGIPEDKREMAFQPFVRLEASRNTQTGGSGLGLAVSQDIIASHGGEIMLDDSPLGGLRIKIRLPL